jgi:hypothetical protein
MIKPHPPTTSSAAGLIWFAMIVAGSPASQAAYIQKGFTDKPDSFVATFDWNFPAAGRDVAGPFTGNCGDGKKCWTVGPISPAPEGGAPTTRTLFIFPQHFPGEIPADVGHGPNMNPGLLEYNGLARPVAGQLATLTRVGANKTLHGNHADYFSGTLKIPRPAI